MMPFQNNCWETFRNCSSWLKLKRLWQICYVVTKFFNYYGDWGGLKGIIGGFSTNYFASALTIIECELGQGELWLWFRVIRRFLSTLQIQQIAPMISVLSHSHTSQFCVLICFFLLLFWHILSYCKNALTCNISTCLKCGLHHLEFRRRKALFSPLIFFSRVSLENMANGYVNSVNLLQIRWF